MRFAWALGVSALLSVAQANVIGRQNNNGNGNGNGNGDGGDEEGGDEEDGPSFSSNPGPSSSSSTDGNNGDRDTTILITSTVTAEVSQATTTTTIDSTSTSTITNIKTARVTDIVTSEVNVYTDVVYTTTTVEAQDVAPQKREQVEAELPANYPSIFTVLITPTHGPAAPEPTAGPNPAARRALEKRQTFTQYTTVTADNDGDAKTITETATRKVVSIKAVDSTTTTHVQKFANAKSTTTVTSTATETAGGKSTGTATGNDNGGNKSDSSSSSGGLSTGAKAGIGAGVGVAGLAVIAGLLFCCLRKRRGPKADPDMMAGSSVVPVSGNGSTRPMSHASSGTYLTPSRAGAALPAKTSPEGYRGTAMGDGRAGYAKPDPYGAAYANAPSRSTTTTTGHRGGADSLPEHPVPGEMNTAAIGTGVSPMTGTPSPVPHNQHMVPPVAGAAAIPTSQAAQPSHPQAVELGSDNAAAAKWHNNDATEIDSQPVMSHQSGPVYEMP